jgi:hypothetical protein
MDKPKKITQQWLDAAFEELREYKDTLEEWDALLIDKSSMLDAWEAKLLAFTEAHSEEFEDIDDEAWMLDPDDKYESIWEIDDKPVRTKKSAVAKSEPNAGAQKDIAELEKLYALPDKRRGKK